MTVGRIVAAVDPGSKRTALVIARAEEGLPLALLHAAIYDVGADIIHPEPIHHPATDTRKAWIETRRHVVTREDEQRVAQDVAAAVLRYGADSVALESVEYVHGETAQQVSQTAHHIAIAERILSAIHTILAKVAVEVVYTSRTSWLAALRRHVAAGLVPGVARIPAKMGRAGRPLDPLLSAYLPALPSLSAAAGGADYRDAAGLLLSGLIAELPVPPARPLPPPKPPKPTRKQQRKPRAALDPATLAAIHEQERARTEAARRTRGCTCPAGHRGRCPRTCPTWRPKPPPVAPPGYRGLRSL